MDIYQGYRRSWIRLVAPGSIFFDINQIISILELAFVKPDVMKNSPKSEVNLYFGAESTNRDNIMRDAMLIVHVLGIAMTAGTVFGFFFLRMAANKMDQADRHRFLLNSSQLYKMGNIGLILLFLSGGYLMTPYWKSLGSMPLLLTKLILFLVLGALLGMMSSSDKKAGKGNAENQLRKTGTLGSISLVVVLAIIILAVSVFH